MHFGVLEQLYSCRHILREQGQGQGGGGGRIASLLRYGPETIRRVSFRLEISLFSVDALLDNLLCRDSGVGTADRRACVLVGRGGGGLPRTIHWMRFGRGGAGGGCCCRRATETAALTRKHFRRANARSRFTYFTASNSLNPYEATPLHFLLSLPTPFDANNIFTACLRRTRPTPRTLGYSGGGQGKRTGQTEQELRRRGVLDEEGRTHHEPRGGERLTTSTFMITAQQSTVVVALRVFVQYVPSIFLAFWGDAKQRTKDRGETNRSHL